MSGIIKHEMGLKFIFGGKSFVTFLNTNTSNRFTYKVVKHKTDDIYFINVLTSPDTYTFFGTYRNGQFKHSPKARISAEAQSVKVFQFVIAKLATNTLSNLIEIYHDGRCGKCGKQLTVPESVETGFGPECYKRIASKQDIRDAKLTQLLKGM
jgi:hypothetical protein